MTITEPIKGFNDYTGEEAIRRAKIKKIAEGTFELYGFEPAETPVIEAEEFVLGDNQNDEAVSDRYKLEDKGKRKLALRYEFTFQLKRIARNKKLPYRRYQIGPVFRDEPTTGNRVRQLTQCDIDIIGSSIKDEAEVLKTFYEVLSKLGIECIFYINNRKLLNEILEELKIPLGLRDVVIREIDKLDKLPEDEVKENLKKYGAQKAVEYFKKPQKFFEKYESYKDIKELSTYCLSYKIPIEFSPFLARGLSYYNGSVFEVKTKAIKETICGGGSYMVNGIQSTGISASIERLSLLAKTTATTKRVVLISLNQDSKSIELAEKIRATGIPCNIFYGKPSKALEYANSYLIPYAVFIGEDEVKSNKFKLKDMLNGKEQMLTVNELIQEIYK